METPAGFPFITSIVIWTDQNSSHYRVADIALVTSLKDGMNLVSREFCAAEAGDKGVLVLSEFAGSADQLRHGALVVNPYDVEAWRKRTAEDFVWWKKRGTYGCESCAERSVTRMSSGGVTGTSRI